MGRIRYIYEDAVDALRDGQINYKRIVIYSVLFIVIIIGVVIVLANRTPEIVLAPEAESYYERETEQLEQTDLTQEDKRIQEENIKQEAQRRTALALSEGVLNDYVTTHGVKGDGLYMVYQEGDDVILFEQAVVDAKQRGPVFLYREDLEQESFVYYPFVINFYAQASSETYLDIEQTPRIFIVRNGRITKTAPHFNFRNIEAFQRFLEGE